MTGVFPCMQEQPIATLPANYQWGVVVPTLVKINDPQYVNNNIYYHYLMQQTQRERLNSKETSDEVYSKLTEVHPKDLALLSY